MSIAYINADDAAPIFGTQASSVHVQEVIRSLARRGLQPRLFAIRFGGPVTAEFSTIRIHNLPSLPRGDAAAREQAALAINGNLHAALDLEFQREPFAAVYERYSLWSYAGMEFAREHGIPGILEVNSPMLEEMNSMRALFDRSGAEEATMRAFRSASIITVVSKPLAHIIENHPSARGKVHVVPNAARSESFSSAVPTFPRNPDEFVVGFVSTLKPWHGLTVLLNAFSVLADALPNARLLIVGDGPSREHLDREIAARDISHLVRFTGAVSPHKIPGLLASMDAAVAPYPALAPFYFSPLKIFEYMAAGLPIVASRIGQIGEILENNKNALLVPPGDANAVAQALYELGTDSELRQRLGSEAAQTAAARHTWEGVIERVLMLAGLKPPQHIVLPPTDPAADEFTQLRRARR